MSNVLLLRAPSQSPDRYESVFSGAGYAPTSIPVLETILVNLEALTDTVRLGPQHGAVIITSGRAGEAWRKALDALDSPHALNQESDWSSTPFYVVGKSTASSLKAIRDAHPRSHLVPNDIRGESSGTSEQLADFIIADLDSSPPESRQKPFLFLTGDKHRDTLPDILHNGNIKLDSLQVYQTQGSSSFPNDLRLTLESHQDSKIWWIVFFAPSAAEFVVPFLRQQFDFRPANANTSLAKRAPRIASIGPTTSTFLQENLNISVDVVASKPTPEDLLHAINAYDTGHDG
ncbi:tetrapyrrole biosynthesis, uroporphyrinogen III synthase [Mycena vitilis]|nr:tetrapyrrole biosynthesis, uroporphyrinogen III synthase [Mycena vitilis]